MQSSEDLKVRNLSFEFDDRIPRHWLGGSAGRTVMFDSLSLFLPPGERFFVESVKPYVSRLRDPALRRKAQAFCGQEAMHQREHVKYNARLEARGYPAATLERTVWRFMALVTFTTLPRWRLAVTCALEHFTAMFAQLALTEPKLLADADPHMARFWRWHAGEELEHRAVPFDVYRAIGGSYLERVLVMLATTLIFRSFAYLYAMRFLWRDGQLSSSRAWREIARAAPWAKIWRHYVMYYRPSFHPQQLDTRAALDEFQTELATYASVGVIAVSGDGHK
ncbi:MAG TPA: metal-dependent hydrolase [Polyangiales bacterium]|nr:metal-dependent hydrolase [Polyangiales bacterium]